MTSNCIVAQKFNLESRYSNITYFSKSQIDSLKNVSYGKAINFMGVLQDLKMDIYFCLQEMLNQKKLILLIFSLKIFFKS